MGSTPGDGEGPGDIALRRTQRRDGHAAQAEAIGGGLIVLLVGDARVHEIVRCPERPPKAGRKAIHPTVQREALDLEPLARRLIGRARHNDRRQGGAVIRQESEVGPVGLEEPLGLVHYLLQDLVRIPDARDSLGDGAQRPFGLDALGQL